MALSKGLKTCLPQEEWQTELGEVKAGLLTSCLLCKGSISTEALCWQGNEYSYEESERRPWILQPRFQCANKRTESFKSAVKERILSARSLAFSEGDCFYEVLFSFPMLWVEESWFVCNLGDLFFFLVYYFLQLGNQVQYWFLLTTFFQTMRRIFFLAGLSQAPVFDLINLEHVVSTVELQLRFTEASWEYWAPSRGYQFQQDRFYYPFPRWLTLT